MTNIKTNVMRILDKAKITYEMSTYEVKDGKIDGEAVAKKLNKDPKQVFKTLVTVGHSKENYVFMIPVEETLDFKKISGLTHEKNMEMLNLGDLQKVTGYIRGGCSPIGMKKQFKTYIHCSIEILDEITFSAGKIGVQVTIKTSDLVDVIDLQIADVIGNVLG